MSLEPGPGVWTEMCEIRQGFARNRRVLFQDKPKKHLEHGVSAFCGCWTISKELHQYSEWTRFLSDPRQFEAASH
jgi:hypothetical protein